MKRVATKGRAKAAAPGTDVEAYLAPLPETSRAALEKLRATIKTAAPGGTDVIAYRIPSYRYEGRLLVGYAAFKDHCSFFLLSTGVMRAHAADLEGYAVGKGSIQFAPGKPLPAALVKKLVKARIVENERIARK